LSVLSEVDNELTLQYVRGVSIHGTEHFNDFYSLGRNKSNLMSAHDPLSAREKMHCAVSR